MASAAVPEGPDALTERLFGAALGAYELLTVYLGDRLGLYTALAERGPLTSSALAEATGIDERYAREWLEQQAVAGFVALDRDGETSERLFRLPEGHEDVFLDRDSLSYLVPMAQFGVAFARVLDAVEGAFRSGGGVPWSEYGDVGRTAQEGANRPQFRNLLASEWIPAMPDVHARMADDPPARIADVACGAGWSSIALALAFPKVRVDGFDLDEPSIEAARRNAVEAGVSDRVAFHIRDAAEGLHGSYQLVAVFEAIHDLSRPADVLRAMRALAADDGAVLVVDERVADRFTAPGDDIERLMYTYSVLCCLPVGLADSPSAATGTVMRTDTLRRYAQEAGFSDLDVLPIEHDVFRFYRLTS